jgi:hypothetical protein
MLHLDCARTKSGLVQNLVLTFLNTRFHIGTTGERSVVPTCNIHNDISSQEVIGLSKCWHLTHVHASRKLSFVVHFKILLVCGPRL